MKPKILVLESIHQDGIEAMKVFADVDIACGLDRIAQLRTVVGYDAVVVRSVIQVDQEFLECGTCLKVVGRAGTGTENIDMESAGGRGIKVLTVPTGNSQSAAEFTVALILALTRKLPLALSMVDAADYRRDLLEGRELTTQTVGLVGLGNVGSGVARRLSGFGCRIIGWDPAPLKAEEFIECGGELTESYEELLKNVDILSFHVRLSTDTTHMLDEQTLKLIKPGLFLINTARARVIDDKAVLAALDDGRIAGVAVDVLEPEPPFDDVPVARDFQHDFLAHPNVIVTPHMAASTEQAQKNIGNSLAAQIETCLD
jgi:D-3-phosphoglycerate dehydrogenase / 2-oxoglutarate reductase